MCRVPGVCLDFSSRIHPACPANKRTPGLREGDCPSEPLASPGRLMLHFSAWVWVLWPGWCMASTLYGMLAAGMWGCFLLVSILCQCCLRKDNMAVPLQSSTMEDTHTTSVVWTEEEGCGLPWDLEQDCRTPNIYDARYFKKFIRVGTATRSARCRSGRVAQPSSPRPCVLVEEEAEKA